MELQLTCHKDFSNWISEFFPTCSLIFFNIYFSVRLVCHRILHQKIIETRYFTEGENDVQLKARVK